MKVVHVLSQARETWDGPRGRIVEETIRTCAKDVIDQAHVYVCGPSPMMASVIQALGAAGVDAKRVYHERFAL